MLETRQQQRTDCATTAPMQTARPRASRSSPEAALRCAAGAGLDGDPHGRATLGRAVWCGATNQPLRRRIPPPRMGPIYPTRNTHSFSRRTNYWRVPSSRLLFAGRSLALVVFEPRLHELVEFLHLFVGVGFWRAVFQPTEHVSFD